MSDEPTDRDIEQQLGWTRPDRWDALSARRRCRGTGARSQRDVGGSQRGRDPHRRREERHVQQMPYLAYSEAVDRLLTALYEAGLFVPFDWRDWDAGSFQGRGDVG